jgi:hypothetical protein
MGGLLAIYLNDHLAGATLGVELARRLRASNEDDPEFGPALERTHAGDLSGFDLAALAERATGQLRRLEALHLEAAALAL